MNRVQQMRNLLEQGNYFKVVCGAGNEDAEEIRRLALVYTLAGANAFDVSADPNIVTSCVAGINRAYELASSFQVEIPIRPFINISVGLPGDHHVRKAFINLKKCIKCKKCIPICPKDAIDQGLNVIKSSCIGCGHCASICPSTNTPITFEHNAKEIEEIVPKCLEAGAENVELHAAVASDDSIMSEWQQVKKLNPDHFISMCLDRAQLSNSALFERVKNACHIAGDMTIIQADGVPMSGGSDDYKTTVQAIAIAELLQKEFYSNPIPSKRKKFYMLLSGGTNSKTAELAKLCDIKYHGLSLGTHARKIIKEYINGQNYKETVDFLSHPIEIAKDLVTKKQQAEKNHVHPL